MALPSTIAVPTALLSQSRFAEFFEFDPNFLCLAQRSAPEGVQVSSDCLPEEVEQAEEGRQLGMLF